MRVLALLFWLPPIASAYIPEYGLVATHAALQHGNGTYKIVQEVTYRTEAGAFAVLETWYVSGENKMQVELLGRGPLKGLVQGNIEYTNNVKKFSDLQVGTVQRKLGPEWIEPLLHFRYSKFFRQRMVDLKIAPAKSLNDRPPIGIQGEVQYSAPSFVQFSRVGSAVAWVISNSWPDPKAPALWLEQDRFVIRKLKLSPEVSFLADRYSKFSNDLWYPQSQTYIFGPSRIEINTLQVQKVKAPPTGDPIAMKLPEIDGLKEFYARFR